LCGKSCPPGIDAESAAIAAAAAQSTAFGLFTGGMALSLSAAWGISKVATFGSIGVVMVSYVDANFVPINPDIAGVAVTLSNRRDIKG
jgi:hypothetical protein